MRGLGREGNGRQRHRTLGSLQEGTVFVFPTAIYILSSYLLETSLQAELEQAISLTPHLSSSFHSFLPLWPCSSPEDIPARLHLMSAVS